MRGAWIVWVLLLVAAPVFAQAPREAPTLVVYHPWPDPEAGRPDADPFSAANVTPLPGLDPARLPATRADGVLDADPAPEGNPDSAVAHVRELQRLLNLRLATGAPASLVIDGALRPGVLALNVTARAHEALGEVEARIVLVEDGATYDGRSHRFVARAVAPLERANLSAAEASLAFAREIPIPPGVDASRVGVAVSLRVLQADARREAGEVVQSASWSPRQEGPTIQDEKAPLVEHVSATWCEPCAASDAALDLLAAQQASTTGSGAYLRAPSPWAWSGALAGVVVGVIALRRRGA